MMTRHYVYRHFDYIGQALYVGCSKNVEARFKLQKSQDKHWAEKVARTKITVHPDKATALEVERNQIRRLEPMYNGEIYFMDVDRWTNALYWHRAAALIRTAKHDNLSPASPLGLLISYYRKNFGRDLLADMGPVDGREVKIRDVRTARQPFNTGRSTRR